MPLDIEQTRFFTFYSYKGGVGRTMALANVACQLANRHGKDIVCIDWDLEAPGLHYYFDFTDKDLAGRAGLLDYLREFMAQVKLGSKGHAPEIEDYLIELKDAQREKIRHGRVRLMHCGQTNRNYTAHVQNFKWEEFYEKYEGFRAIEMLRTQLIDVAGADLVLIDARAGQAEVGTTPTIQMPDAVVLLFTCNAQSLEGTDRIVRGLVNHPMREEIGRTPKVLLVPARVFPREEKFQRWLEGEPQRVFDRLVEDGIISKLDQPRGLHQCVIPVDAKWAVDESLPMLESETDPADQRTPAINRAYITLAQALDNLHKGREAWSPRMESAPPASLTGRVETLGREIQSATDRGDDAGVALLQFKLGQAYIDQRRVDEAEGMLQASLVFNQGVKNQKAVSAIYHDLGRVRLEHCAFGEAYTLFERSLALDEQAGDKRGQGVTLHEMGRVRFHQRAFKKAWTLFERALALKVQAGDERGQGVTVNEMGHVRSKQGRLDEALALYERSLALVKEFGDDRAQSVLMQSVGIVRLAMENVEAAESILKIGLAKAQAAGDEEGIKAISESLEKCQEAKRSGKKLKASTSPSRVAKPRAKSHKPKKTKARKARASKRT